MSREQAIRATIRRRLAAATSGRGYKAWLEARAAQRLAEEIKAPGLARLAALQCVRLEQGAKAVTICDAPAVARRTDGRKAA